MGKESDVSNMVATVSRRRLLTIAGVGATLIAANPLASTVGLAQTDDNRGPNNASRDNSGRRWRPGDHHIHSEYSVGLNNNTTPPTPIIGGDAVYPIVANAIMAKNFGLEWMVCTDHGGPNHSKVNVERAYPDLVRSRRLVPEVLQFFGMEFNAPARDHHTLIIPRHAGEAQQLFDIESRFDKNEPFPADPSRDTEAKMEEALRFMAAQQPNPYLIANHAARSASGLGVYGQDTPRELRHASDVAPNIFHGFEGAPGHQAGPLLGGARGAYGNHHTYGGFDQMTARVGGLWDSLLGEGRKWWITATSDSHVHWTRGGSDFWPGEYSKSYVFARTDYDDVLDALRNGRIFVTTGDLITGLDVFASGPGGRAGISETLQVRGSRRGDVDIEIHVKPLQGKNFNGDQPQVRRVDLIVGQILGPNPNPDADTNPTTSVVARFGPNDWRRQGDELVMRHTLRNVEGKLYARVRGTSTDESEPQLDQLENPWSDLWFYSNPVFIEVG